MERRALIGMHDAGLPEALVAILKSRGYVSDVAHNVGEMVDFTTKSEYRLYLMDLNFGNPGSTNIAPAISVYTIIKERVERGEAKFMGKSSNPEAVESARKIGITCMDGLEFVKTLTEHLKD